MHHQPNQNGSQFGAFLLGAATALVVGGYFLYGPEGKQHQKKIERGVMRAKAEILERMRKTQDMTEEQYRNTVDQVIATYVKAKAVTEEHAERASAQFKQKWNEMREMAKDAANEARKELAEEKNNEEAMSHSKDRWPGI